MLSGAELVQDGALGSASRPAQRVTHLPLSRAPVLLCGGATYSQLSLLGPAHPGSPKPPRLAVGVQSCLFPVKNNKNGAREECVGEQIWETIKKLNKHTGGL